MHRRGTLLQHPKSDRTSFVQANHLHCLMPVCHAMQCCMHISNIDMLCQALMPIAAHASGHIEQKPKNVLANSLQSDLAISALLPILVSLRVQFRSNKGATKNVAKGKAGNPLKSNPIKSNPLSGGGNPLSGGGNPLSGGAGNKAASKAKSVASKASSKVQNSPFASSGRISLVLLCTSPLTRMSDERASTCLHSKIWPCSCAKPFVLLHNEDTK